jgi:hypothetical protein
MSCIEKVCSELIRYCHKYSSTSETWCKCAVENYINLCEKDDNQSILFAPLLALSLLLFICIPVVGICCHYKNRKLPPIYELPPSYKEERTASI